MKFVLLNLNADHIHADIIFTKKTTSPKMFCSLQFYIVAITHIAIRIGVIDNN